MQYGLTPPNAAPAAGSAVSAPVGVAPPPVPQQLNIGGIVSVKNLASTLAVDANAAQQRALAAQADTVLQGIAGQVRRHWMLARDAKLPIEAKMLNAVRARRGEYPPDKLTKIRQQGGSEIYMMLFSTKARQAKALLTDVFIGAGTEKPWTFHPTPKPDLPPEQVSEIMQAVQEMVLQAELNMQPMMVDEIRDIMRDARDRAESQIMEIARHGAECAEPIIEDILVEGGWLQAMDEFLDDITTFKTAFIKGPVIRNVPQLTWERGADGTSSPVVANVQKRFWERTDPFNMYPVPWARSVDDAPLIERHKLTRSELSGLIGVAGYSDDAIRAVLQAHGSGGLHEWLSIDVQKPDAEGRQVTTANQSDLIDALQYWGSVSGKMLREWGMKPNEVPDEAKEYQVECWLIGSWVIKCVLNQDPLGRRPYYADGYSRVPGAFWHNSLYDLIEDCVDMCNAAARALANNLGIASGPQVDVNVERLATGEDITAMYPWKIWQTKSDPMGSTSKAVNFFQPQSNAQELMGVYEKYSMMADEYSGIPRYMTGVEGTPGAGRTASGLSMMIGNASKTIKQLVGSIDMRVVSPCVEREYDSQRQSNKDIYGDLKIVARGALSLSTRESAQVRRNEFLAMVGQNPAVQQVVGMEGIAEIVRSTAKTLDMDVDKIVPSRSMLRQKMMQAQAGQQPAAPGGEQLMDGAPTTDHFSPAPA